MKIAVYTSFAINYLAKARVLAHSLRKNSPAVHLVAIVCDRFPAGLNIADEPFDSIWLVTEYPTDSIMSWIFRHNVMELCTAVKGWGLDRLLAAGYDFVMYLDPDCWVLDDVLKILPLLHEGKSVAVVPHITATAKTSEAIRTIEISSLKHGIYNLGFLLVRNDINGKDFARWWAERLHDYCIVDHAQGLFTDQRWIDLAVGTFDFFSVLRHHGLDVASWNMPYRNITRRGEGYSADGDDLIFYHFSGIGRGNAHRWVREMFAPAGPIVADLEFRYEQTINDCGQNELEKIQPAYDRFDTGETIDAFDRKFYRDNEEFRRAHPNPYSEISARALKQSHVAAANVIRGSAGPRPSAVTHEHTAQLLFDRDFYSKVYGLSCFWDPWSAYLALGARADHKPNAFFEPTFYRAMVGSRSLRRYRTPLHHYVKEGLLSGVPPIWNFDESYYLEANEDVRDAVAQGALVCGFHHYMIAGAAEGRSPSGFFDETAYLRQNPDVANAVRAGVFRSGGEHFIRHGRAEGRARTVIAPA